MVASLNDCTVPGSWREAHRDVVVRQHGDNPLKESNQYMFQKPSEKSFSKSVHVQYLLKRSQYFVKNRPKIDFKTPSYQTLS